METAKVVNEKSGLGSSPTCSFDERGLGLSDMVFPNPGKGTPKTSQLRFLRKLGVLRIILWVRSRFHLEALVANS